MLGLSDAADRFHVFMGSVLSSKYLRDSSKQIAFRNGPQLLLIPTTGMQLTNSGVYCHRSWSL